MPPYSQDPKNRPQIQGSPQQLDIWDAFEKRNEHIIIEALAGTGKTTTGVEGLRPIVAKGLQAQFLAFNKSIATELQGKVPAGAKAQTFHGAGFGAVRNQFGQLEVDSDRTYKMLPDRLPRQYKSAIIKLVSICKNVLCDASNRQELLDLCAQYDIDLYGERGAPEGQQAGWQGEDPTDEIFKWVRDCLEKSKTPTGSIDFDDMVWLPVIWGLPVRKYDFLIVDESQDLNRTQQELALMIGKRIIMVGDKHQAIYGFRGADVDSMQNMAERLQATPRGLLTLPLTVTRRCPRLVTALAREIVPDFECLGDAPVGHVCFGDYYLQIDPQLDKTGPNFHWEYKYTRVKYSEVVYATSEGKFESDPGYCPDTEPKKGDMVLCRTNAPLIAMAYQLIRAQVPCKIQGRDFGKGLENLIKQLVPQTASTPDLLRALSVWEGKERAKIEAAANGHETRMQTQLSNLQDKVDCIEALTENLDTAAEVVSRIQLLFQDIHKDGANSSSFVLLSSVHRAKGLQSKVVRIIKPELLPHPMARLPWQKEQEMNLKYVAITRSMDTLHIHD